MRGSEANAQAKEAQQAKPLALLFELEYLAVPGRKVTYEVLKGLLAERDAELTPLLFARHCTKPPLKDAIPFLLKAVDKARLSADKLAQQITDGVRAAVLGPDYGLSKGLKQTLEYAAKEHMPAGALTALDNEAAGLLLERLGLRDIDIEVLSCAKDEKPFPSPDAWLKLAKIVGVIPRRCIVIGTSAGGCRSALSAGMRCIAVPDDFTAHQDFTGAEVVARDLKPDLLKDLLESIRTSV